jgi:hypothetical protein
MVPRPAPGCAARQGDLRLVHGCIAACLLASLAGCADLLGIEDLSPRIDAGVDDGGAGDGGGPAPAPALRTPMNGSRVGSLSLVDSRRPAFTWDPIEDATYVLEYSTDPTFATGVTRVESSVPSHRPLADLPVSRVPPVGARYHWRVSTCIGARCSRPSQSWYFDVARLRPDVNGDGYDEVLVGAPTDQQGAILAGRIYAYQGQPGTSFDTQVDGEVPSFAGNEQLGESVALGDFDGDGFAEIVGGTPLRLDASGGVQVFPSTAESPALINAPITVPGQVPGVSFGITLTTGDFNADGFADLVVGDVGPGASGDQPGHLSVYLGTPGGFDAGIDQIIVGFEVGDGFGGVVASGGDVNGDGYEDLLVGIPGARQVDIHFGGPDSPFEDQPSAVLSEPGLASFATSVAGAGDVDGDGYHDVLVGLPDSVYLYRGGPGAFDIDPDGVVSGLGQPGYGTAISSAGDMDGDGGTELIVAYSNDATSWGIAVYSSTDGLFSNLRMNLALAGSIDTAALSEPADFNGDGLSDVVMTGGPNTGVHVYLGGDFLIPETAVLQSIPDDSFGAAVAP